MELINKILEKFGKKKEEPEKEEAKQPLADDYTTKIIESLLTKLNCTYKVQEIKDRNCMRYHFSFQACNFSIDAFKKSHKAYLLFPYVAATSIDEIELYKKVCMEMNYYQTPTKFVYYTDESDGEVYININHSLYFFEEAYDNLEYLQAAFDDMFRFRYLMTQEIDKQRANLNYDKRCDYRKEVDSRMSYLLHQQEENNQYFPINRDNLASGQNLLGFLDYFFSIRKSDIKSLKIINSSELTTVSAEAIKNGDFALDKYRILESVVCFDEDTKEVYKRADDALIEIEYNVAALAEKFETTPTRKIIISLVVENDSDDSIFVRATATHTPLPTSRSASMNSKSHKPESYSVLLCAEKRDESSFKQEFEYLWKEAQDLAANNDFNSMSDEQRLICSVQEIDIAYHVYWGTKLLTECRYYEAIFYLETAFTRLQDKFATATDHDKRTFAHVSYQLGFAFAELNQARRALYYAEIGFAYGQKIAYTECYINNLVNCNDFRSLSVIDDHLRRTVEYEQQTGGDETASYLKSFLLRRKATVLINQHLFDDAHEYLTELAKNPDYTDFVNKEMTRLKKIENLEKKA